VLDLGCGNGGICEYIHQQTGAVVYGLDYSDAAIRYARKRAAGCAALRFDVGVFGQWDYPPASFDVALSVDTMYFVDDTEAFIRQIYGWLKDGGALGVMYGCYDKIEPDIGRDVNSLATAFRAADYTYDAIDYTESHYNLMKRKRMTIERQGWRTSSGGRDSDTSAIGSSPNPLRIRTRHLKNLHDITHGICIF